MKQPDKMIAYYYRAATETDLHLDNQMHRLRCKALKGGEQA
jgi:hypothetical protein